MSTTPSDIIALLIQCQTLQSEKDGIHRPVPRAVDVGQGETYDDFARRIQQACVVVSQFRLLQQMESDLTTAGMLLERQGRLQVSVGESYARATCNFFLAQLPPVTGLNGVDA